MSSGTSSNCEVGVVLDNGACHVKAGLLPLCDSVMPANTPHIIPLLATNALARVGPNATAGCVGTSRRPQHMIVGAEIDSAPDFSGMSFRRAHDRGYVARWDAERDVWSSVFSSDMGIGLRNASSAALLLTEPLAMPVHIRRATDELVFEVFGFQEYTAVSAARLVALRAEHSSPLSITKSHGFGRHSCIVLDSGFSFTHAVPIVEGREVRSCVRRLNLGGKAITNHLKETISFRSWNMMEESAVVNAVKERTCRVSANFLGELGAAKGKKSPLRLEYMLPDMSCGGADPLGHIRRPNEEVDGSEQVLIMNNERIAVPELLFHPSDLGIPQSGVAELVVQAVESCPEMHRADMYANVILAGGNCRFPGFKERLLAELRPLVSDLYEVRVYADDDPLFSAFRGGVDAFRCGVGCFAPSVTKAEYEEHGHALTLARFGYDTF